ncbi:MAG: inositol monophosphatase family protein [Bacteriovoracia bacterium]
MFAPYLGQQLLSELRHFCDSLSDINYTETKLKSDNTFITEIDTKISEFFKQHSAAKGYHFYSEEEHTSLQFPALILDPIDGTRELVAGRAECAVSAAFMSSPKLVDGHALILNPFTGYSLSSHDKASWIPQKINRRPLGLVSRSEWEANLFTSKKGEFDLIARGSIAFKLALLASGAADFVVSLKPKNIWDIAAGTMLCHQRGIEMWCADALITDLSQEKYSAPLIWCRPELRAILRETFLT